ncbi:MAG TPA: ElyC/SanA/YdcF family protein [Polaromonas sp.]|nr:ElyC/SanA/YdcF family protein [Polaromonas sp.]
MQQPVDFGALKPLLTSLALPPLAPLLQRDGVQRIALVTDAWHMPHAVAAFERAGLTVTPAPTGFILPLERDLLEWLPFANGLLASREVLREWLALAVAHLIPL